MANDLSYADACAQAATAQGLDPITARLDAEFGAGTVDVAQTGGFCMVAYVYGDPITRYLGFTDSESTMGAEPGAVYVVQYDDSEGYDEGTVVAEGATLDEVVEYVRAWFDRYGRAQA